MFTYGSFDDLDREQLIAILYVGGLWLLPRQWRQERVARGKGQAAFHEYKKLELMDT